MFIANSAVFGDLPNFLVVGPPNPWRFAKTAQEPAGHDITGTFRWPIFPQIRLQDVSLLRSKMSSYV